VLSLSGYATLAVYEGILQSVTYENISENPSSAARTIELTAVDFDATYPTGGATININVIPVNDAPAVNVMAIGVLSYTENNPPVVIGPGIVLQDVDNSNLSGATVSMTTNFTSGEDVLVFTNQNGITGVYDPATGVLTLSGTSSVLNYQTALRSVSYQNTSENPVVFTRTISFQADDGMNLSSPDTRSVNVIATNDAPVLTSTLTNPPAYVSGDYVIDNTIAISDLDNLNLNSATISIVSGFASSEDELIFTNQGGISGSYNPSSGVLTLSGSALLTVYRDALRTVVYSNSSTSPVSTGRTIEFIVNDGSDNSNAASITIGFDINQPPVIGAITGTATVGGFITVDLAPFLSDPDNNLDVSTLSIISQPSSGAVASLTGTDLMINYAGLNFTGPDQLMIEVCDLLGLCTQANITINVSNNPPVINPPSSDPILVGTTFSIDLSPFLSDPDGNLDLSTLSIVVQPSSGALAILNGATLEVDYAGVAEFSGTDELTIEVCDQSGVCTQAVITILVEGDMVVNNGISPNGDDKNDYWIIENILLEPENTVSIYSRWGDNIYEVENYNNTTVVFGGLNNNGKEVASGVYFYRIEFKSGRPTLTGSLTIKR
jgi:gliding motility-associated-like protein